MAALPVPVHFVCICNRGQCEVVHGGPCWEHRGGCQRRTSGAWERLLLSSAVPGLGGGHWRSDGSPCLCST